MPQIKQQKGFYSDDKAQIVKVIKEGFVNVQKEMWEHRGKLTCGMAYKKVKRNPTLILQESNVTFDQSWSCVTGDRAVENLSTLLFQTPISNFK